MVDLTKTVEPKSDQLNADDLIAGPRTITITRVTASDTPEQPVSVWWREHWHAGRVERVDGDRYWVSYGQSAQEWVDASRLRPR